MFAAQDSPHRVIAEFDVDSPPESIDGVREMEALDPLRQFLTDTVDNENEVTDLMALLLATAAGAFD